MQNLGNISVGTFMGRAGKLERLRRCIIWHQGRAVRYGKKMNSLIHFLHFTIYDIYLHILKSPLKDPMTSHFYPLLFSLQSLQTIYHSWLTSQVVSIKTFYIFMLVINHNWVKIRFSFNSNKAQTAKTIFKITKKGQYKTEQLRTLKEREGERERDRLINIKAESSKNILHK
jgi:hypothetical protein